MDLQTRKKSFVREFLTINNEEVIMRLEKKLQQEKKKSIDADFPFPIEVLKARIENSYQDSINGRLTEENDFLAEMALWD